MAARFHLDRPAVLRSAAIFSSPHSGRDYPARFLARARLGFPALRASEDAFVDELFASAPAYGAPLLTAIAPRAYVDLNRAPEEMDPAVVAGVRASGLNPRVAAGLGVIPRIVAEGRPIYHGKIPREEAEARIADWHRPYHERLEILIDDALRQFGRAVLYDCHSMPSDALRGGTRGRQGRADIVLGDRFGASASSEVMDAAVAAFESAGFAVACNAPFAGGHITQRYGRPARGVHALQIEIDRGLYLDEATVERRADFADFAAVLDRILPALTGTGRAGLLAAE